MHGGRPNQGPGSDLRWKSAATVDNSRTQPREMYAVIVNSSTIEFIPVRAVRCEQPQSVTGAEPGCCRGGGCEQVSTASDEHVSGRHHTTVTTLHRPIGPYTSLLVSGGGISVIMAASSLSSDPPPAPGL
ncbi:hypothetical protein HRR83_005334 [Exophiala dermatitidis]|uniref:Uncharacterized protein n=1 Tax=Exophiala dermatitidis TaxID=5970 RepID=A0AAN6EW52_EXODE|nr:hypothetical protein HRR74_005187 [Exophiala dermatitidis]KAJ4518565.1 hypothetical protein HRR73_004146 [Exophiala dermatitidis]KAJ4534069.1 hypothetical protein HRR76_006011 [Exophiala dermatitidis]KAJ4550222.1 hypothetical protein HRR77_003697 [Exophiala dermatitidis]KAJ4571533.1 hypothetical protein HRR81_005564 [Exophiala dermatitidis]